MSATLTGALSGGDEISAKLLEIARVIPQSVRRGVAHRTQIRQKFLDRRFHSSGYSEAPYVHPLQFVILRVRLGGRRNPLLRIAAAPRHGLPAPTSSGVASSAPIPAPRFPNRSLPSSRRARAGLAALFHDKGSAALRAGLRDWPVWRGEIAFRVAIAAVEDAPPAFLGHALEQFAGAAFRAVDAQRLGANEFALGIRRAADEFAVLPVLQHQLRAAIGAIFVRADRPAAAPRACRQPAAASSCNPDSPSTPGTRPSARA